MEQIDKFVIKINDDTELIENSDEFIGHIIENSNSNKTLNLSGLGIIMLNLSSHVNSHVNSHANTLNKFTKIDLSNNMLKIIKSIPTHIVDLDISFNKFKNINFIKNLTNLKVLNISYNCGLVIQSDIFDNLTNLKTLNMAGNYLENIPGELFNKLEMLEYLNLAGNNLNTVENIIFPKNISILNITYNNIKKEECEELAKAMSRVIF